MTNKKKSHASGIADSETVAASRRKLLKRSATAATVLAAAELPKYWKSPVVNSVVLPSHAATTDGGGTDLSGVVYFGPVLMRLMGENLSNTEKSQVVDHSDTSGSQLNLVSRMRDYLVPEASAQIIIDNPVPVREVETLLCVTPSGPNYSVLMSSQFGSTIIHRFTTVALNTFGVLVTSPLCGFESNSLQIRLTNPTASGIDYEFVTGVKNAESLTGMIPASPCNIPAENCPISDGTGPVIIRTEEPTE